MTRRVCSTGLPILLYRGRPCIQVAISVDELYGLETGGDPGLAVERANSVEGSLRVRLDRARFDGSVWAASFDNFIFGGLTGRTCSEDHVCVAGDSEELNELFYDQRGATFWGMEGQVTLDLYDTGAGLLQGRLLGDYVRAKLHNAGNVPRIPPYHLGIGLTWEGDRLASGVLLKYTGSQDKIGAGETPTKGFVSLDAHVACHPLASYPGLEVALVGHNLSNTVQRNAVALNKDEVILQGRNASLTVNMLF